MMVSRSHKDPSIHALGFHCFRLFRIPRTSQFDAVPFVDASSSMSVLARAA